MPCSAWNWRDQRCQRTGSFVHTDDGCKGNLRFPITQTSDFYKFEVVAPGLMQGMESETTTWVGQDGVEATV